MEPYHWPITLARLMPIYGHIHFKKCVLGRYFEQNTPINRLRAFNTIVTFSLNLQNSNLWWKNFLFSLFFLLFFPTCSIVGTNFDLLCFYVVESKFRLLPTNFDPLNTIPFIKTVSKAKNMSKMNIFRQKWTKMNQKWTFMILIKSYRLLVADHDPYHKKLISRTFEKLV